MSDPDRLDDLLGGARDELRTQVSTQPIPEFRESNHVVQRTVVVVFAVLAGAGAWLGIRGSEAEVDSVNVPDNPVLDEDPTTTLPDGEPSTTQAVDVGLTELLGDWTPIEGQDDSTPVVDRERFATGEWTADPVWGTPVRRVTDTTGERFHRLQSPGRSPQSSDGRWLLTRRSESWVAVDLDNDADIELPLPRDVEPMWAPDSNVIRHLSGSNSNDGSLTVATINLDGEALGVADLTDRIQAEAPEAIYMHGRDSGGLSADGNRVAWALYDDAEQIVGFVAYDLATDEILGVHRGLPTGELGSLVFVSITPTGERVVVGFLNDMIVFGADMVEQRRLGQQTERPGVARNGSGADVVVTANFDSATDDAGWLVVYDLESGVPTRLYDLFDGANTAIDVAGLAHDRPGWVLASTHDCKQDVAWTCDRLFALNIDDGRIINLAHTYSCASSTFAEPEAVVNRDFSRAWFNSDAGSCTEAAEVYEIAIPAAAFN